MSDYPIYRSEGDRLELPSGRSVRDLDLESLASGEIDGSDLGVRAEVLRKQAEVAEAGGFRALAENLRRAAELVAVPDEEVLSLYDALRPGRGDAKQLDDLASRLETVYGATRTATFFREAAADRRARDPG